jgi:hypothetical protein
MLHIEIWMKIGLNNRHNTDKKYNSVTIKYSPLPCSIFFNGATTPTGLGPPHYRGFTITFRHTTFGRIPLDE